LSRALRASEALFFSLEEKLHRLTQGRRDAKRDASALVPTSGEGVARPPNAPSIAQKVPDKRVQIWKVSCPCSNLEIDDEQSR
jgi:hypothetical protein